LSSQNLAKNSVGSQLVLIAPQIPINPEDAFFPLRRFKDGTIGPTFQWDECPTYAIACSLHLKKWVEKRVEFPDLEWFLANGYGLTKLNKPSVIK
jgi:hypothetical protein